MKTPLTTSGRLPPLCILLSVALAGAVGIGTWAMLMPPAHDHPAIRLAGKGPSLGECIARALRVSSRLVAEGGANPPPTQISVLTDAAQGTTRIVYEGSVRVNFVVTVSETGPATAEARLTTFPVFNPSATVQAAVRGCGAR